MIERWLAGCEPYPARDEACASQTRELVRRIADQVGLDPIATESLCIAGSELAMNALRHGRDGVLAVRAVRRLGTPGVEVVAADRGPGIPDAALALRGGEPTLRSLGAGLSAARRMSQELDVDTRVGEGTCIRARTFAGPVARSEVAIHGKALAGEPVSGDDALVVRSEDSLLLAVCDGMGHGPEARAASAAALRAIAAALEAEPAAPLTDLIGRAALAAAGTRGAVLSIVRLALATRAIEHAGLGDVQVMVSSPGAAQLLPSRPGHLPGPREPRPGARARVNQASLGPHGALVLFTDGLRSAAASALPGPPGEPIALAQDLAARFARGTDDLLVAVAR